MPHIIYTEDDRLMTRQADTRLGAEWQAFLLGITSYLRGNPTRVVIETYESSIPAD